jgi:hypothetical protein
VKPVSFKEFDFLVCKISAVPGQTPNVLGEEQSWSEVDTPEVEFLSQFTAQRWLPKESDQKAISYNKLF